MTIFRLTIILFLLTSCENRIEREKLIGKYVWNDGRIDTLDLRADGTYEYWAFRPGRKVAHSGTWKFNSGASEVEFDKENFPFLNDNDRECGSWFSPVRLKNHEIHLMYATKNNIYFKQNKIQWE